MLHPFSDLQAFQRDTLGFMLNRGCAATEPLVQLRVGISPVFLVADPSLAKHILKETEDKLDKGRLIWKMREVLGRSSLTISGEEHRTRRAAIHRQLATGVAGNYIPIICSIIDQWIAETTAQKEDIKVHQTTARLAMRIIGAIVFGHNVLSRADETAIVEAVALAEDDLAARIFQVLPDMPWQKRAKKEKLARAKAIMTNVVARNRPKATEGSLMQAFEELALDDQTLNEEVMLMLLSGHHTSGTAMAWLVYYLATDSDLNQKLVEESALLTKDGLELTASSIRKAPISKKFVQEVVRLYPSTYWLSRETKRSISLGDRVLKKGTSLIISPWHYHRDAKYWNEPDQFNIDRKFVGDHYMPFGLGARACVGMNLAMLELQLLALNFASSINARVTSQIPAAPPRASITLHPSDIRISVTPAKPNVSTFQDVA
ncbi:MAG: cytochrome P450 [Cohaesibacter sp.]|jgi:cytochrome P450|nr:cytochrome P450 [Cohaesibacter sp.]